MRNTLEERFWAKVKKTEHCWDWTASKLKTGYGQMGLGGRKAGHDVAHRISWKIHNGEIPKGLHVLHKCDNRGCVRPDHLFLGTPLDNMRDMHAKGRACNISGISHPNAKLDHEKVREIRKRLANGDIIHQIASSFSVNWTTIAQIRDGKTWRAVR
jgi:hypothetical protein